MLLPHRWADIVFVPMIKASLSFFFGLHFCVYLLLYAALRLLHLKVAGILYSMRVLCFNIYAGYLVTSQILANMFNNSTQHLAAVHGYFNLPVVWSQFSSISLHLRVLMALFLGSPGFLNYNWTSPRLTVWLCGEHWMRAFRVKIYTPASWYIVAFKCPSQLNKMT